MTDHIGEDVPTPDEIMAETNPTRRAILSAMVRMVEGRGKTTRLSVLGLAREAGIDRGQLTTGAHKDLGARMTRIVNAGTTIETAREQELIDDLAKAIERAREAESRHKTAVRDRDMWRARFERLAKDAVLLSTENTNLANRLAAVRSRVDVRDRLHSVE